LRRWTNGDAVVPMPAADLLAPGPCILEVETAAAALCYPLPAVQETEVERVVHGLIRAAA
jgi:hypothetical protein